MLIVRHVVSFELHGGARAGRITREASFIEVKIIVEVSGVNEPKTLLLIIKGDRTAHVCHLLSHNLAEHETGKPEQQKSEGPSG